MTGALLQFALCALLIARAGWTLSHSADRLATLHGWGRGWVGLAMLGTVTSLPELASGISAVAIVGAPNLAVGNALGACVVNLGFLVVVDALQRDQPMYHAAAATHVLSAAFGVVLLGLAALAMLAGARAPAVMNLGLASPLLLGGYLLALRGVHAQTIPTTDTVPSGPADAFERRLHWQRFAIAAAVVLAAGSALPYAADRVAEAAGWSRSFVGTVFMAVATTLPEMAVTLGALRLGALDLAIGNLLGSNLFNVTILAVDDIFHPGGPLLAAVAPVNVGTAVTAMTMAGGVLVGLVLRPQGRVLRVLSWVSVGLLGGVLVNALLLALAGAGG